MSRPATGRPTDFELAVLQVLWDRGPATVREVQAALAESRGAGYTTVLKIMQIMRDKGLILCDARQRPQVYRAKNSRQKTLRKLAGDLLERAFDGSARLLLVHALEHKPASADELAAIRTFLDQLEGKSP